MEKTQKIEPLKRRFHGVSGKFSQSPTWVNRLENLIFTKIYNEVFKLLSLPEDVMLLKINKNVKFI